VWHWWQLQWRWEDDVELKIENGELKMIKK
jgi:hypothetical protein